MAEALKAYGVHTPIRVIPTGIEPHVYDGGDGARFRTRHGIAPDHTTLVYVGRLAHEKNLDFLLNALRAAREKLPQVCLILAGEGPAEPHLRELAGTLGLAAHVRFVGRPETAEDRRDCYRAGDCFVFASRTETQGLPLLEAMACGVAVVALSTMGTADILKARRGSVTARDDVRDFAAEVVALLRDPERRERLGREGRAFAQEWSASAMAERMLDLYTDVCAARMPFIRAAAR
jgi:glycosyltransferase involved in cell wall biosynthesis